LFWNWSFQITIPAETMIRKYNIDQTIGKTILGGVIDDLFRLAYHVSSTFIIIKYIID
jgi:hypothetical protein